MDERTLIATCFAGRRNGRDDVIEGIGDDGAVLRVEPGFDLVVVTDMVVEGTHFPPGIPADAVGHRSLAVNLSDLGAMGAEPLWCSLALSLPAIEPAWVRGFADGLFALADRYGVALVGGDTVRGPLSAAVTACGRIRPGRAVRRRGAQPGDGIWVTGHPGDAVAGRLLLAEAAESAAADRLRQHFLYPEPRVREGQALAEVASAMLDISDGLHDDLGKLLAASEVGADLDAGQLPLSAELLAFDPGRAIEFALTGGDDYELCFSVPQTGEDRLREIIRGWSVAVTRIGTIVPGAGMRWTLAQRPYEVPDSTFRHFA